MTGNDDKAASVEPKIRLVCPLTKRPLRRAPAAWIGKLNGAIARGTLRDAASALIDEPIEAAWIETVSRRGFPVRDGILSMVWEDSFDWSDFASELDPSELDPSKLDASKLDASETEKI